jgi:C-terminal processing protease CtpA/Prc
MKKILKWFSALLFVSVTIFLIYFLISINDDVYIESAPLEKEEKPLSKKVEKNWLEHFSKAQQQGYTYPVNEIYIQVDLEEKITKAITYKLSAKLKDPYQLFCLKEELRRHNLKYFLKKDKLGIDLFIYSQNVDKLKNLVEVLKDYKIKASIKPYNEEN